MSSFEQRNGGMPRAVRQVQRPPSPNRPYTEADYREQRRMAERPGFWWSDQYEIPARPWSMVSERFCEEVRREIEMSDFQADRKFRRREG